MSKIAFWYSEKVSKKLIYGENRRKNMQEWSSVLVNVAYEYVIV